MLSNVPQRICGHFPNRYHVLETPENHCTTNKCGILLLSSDTYRIKAKFLMQQQLSMVPRAMRRPGALYFHLVCPAVRLLFVPFSVPQAYRIYFGRRTSCAGRMPAITAVGQYAVRAIKSIHMQSPQGGQVHYWPVDAVVGTAGGLQLFRSLPFCLLQNDDMVCNSSIFAYCSMRHCDIII